MKGKILISAVFSLLLSFKFFAQNFIKEKMKAVRFLPSYYISGKYFQTLGRMVIV